MKRPPLLPMDEFEAKERPRRGGSIPRGGIIEGRLRREGVECVHKSRVILEKHAEKQIRIEVWAVSVLCRGNAGRLAAEHVRTAGRLEVKPSKKRKRYGIGVILRALGFVAEDAKRRRDTLECICSTRIRVLIGMEFNGKLK